MTVMIKMMVMILMMVMIVMMVMNVMMVMIVMMFGLAIWREYLIFVTYDHKNGNEDNELLMV